MLRFSPLACVIAFLAVICASPIASAADEPVPATTAVKQAMTDFTLTDTPLVDALVSYQAKTKAKITVDWDALRAAGVTPKSRVTVAASRLTLTQVLDLTLARVRGAKAPLCWIITGKSIHITSHAALLGAARGTPTLPTQSTRTRQGQPTQRKPKGVTLDFEEAPASEVVAYFRQIYPKMNYFAAWAALEAVGVSKDTPVTLKVTQPVPLAQALTLFVGTFNGGKEPRQQVFWEFRRNILSITTGEVLDRKMEVKSFNVQDLLMVVPNFVGPTVSVQRSQASSGSGGDSGSNSQGGFGSRGGGGGFGQSSASTGTPGAPGQQAADQTRLQREQQLIEIFQNAIGDEYWQPLGKGSIRILRGQMIVNQSRLGWRLLAESLGGSAR